MTINGNNILLSVVVLSYVCASCALKIGGFKEKFKRAILRGNEKQASDTKKRIGSEVEKVMIFSMVRFWFVLFETWLW